jgi:hypothetical protein
MLARKAHHWTLGACGLLAATGVVLTGIAAETPVAVAVGAAVAPDSLTTQLGGPGRPITAASTDKPIYKPGETVYVRGVVVDHATHAPLSGDQPHAVIEIKGPKGDSVASGTVQAAESVLGFQWTIPEGQAGGEYTLTISYPWQGYAPAERTFDIRAYRAPRLKSQITFVRDGYGPGDDVTAGLSVKRAEGGIPVGASVTAIARVDGVEVFRGPSTIDALGTCQVMFQLPAAIERGEGTLALVIDDSGVVETASKTIPILLQTVDLTMYPEGGDLVAGVSNRVYFEAFTPSHKPADLAGNVIDAAGTVVATFQSQHEGRGRFEFTPKANEKYALHITAPAGIQTTYDLPAVKPAGVAFSSTADVTAADGKVTLRLASPTPGTFTVNLRQRDLLLDAKKTTLRPGEPAEILLDAKEAGGVLTATVYDASGKPLAERLVFRQPSEHVSVRITPDASRYVPGGKVSLTIETSDAKGSRIPAVVGITVTDDSILEMIETREQAPRLPVMVLLEPEVKELADAHVYLDPDNKTAPLAVDLLLGTQGWRRFATVDLPTFLVTNGDAARRALAVVQVVPPSASALAAFDGAAWGNNRLRGLQPPMPQAAAMPVFNAAAPMDAPMPVPHELNGKLHDIVRMEKQKTESQLRIGGRLFADAEKDDWDGGREDRQAAIRNDFVAVRVYAHDVRPNRQAGERSDFAETLYWSAGIKTDATGTANVEFALSDSVTSFRVAADALSDTGGLGAGTATIESVEPFYVEPKLPLHVTVGDRINLPLGIVNATSLAMNDVSLVIDAPNGIALVGQLPHLTIGANGRIRQVLPFDVTAAGEGSFSIAATGSGYADKVIRTLSARPRGFPAGRAFGGLLEPGGVVKGSIVIPADRVPGSIASRIRVYPTPLATMTSAMERLICEPCGCFEQTSSTTYPLVMAQRYFKSHQGIDPGLISKSEDILARGYDRLMGFESPTKGFEWFGADPGHDALTAYGLMQFTEMAQVRPVDSQMLDRTRTWLLAQRDGTGGYARKTHTLHTWVTDPDCAATYNTWALLAAGVKDGLDKEIAYAIDRGEQSNNTYAAALAANVAVLANDKDATTRLLDRLAVVQQRDGSLSGATTSIVGSSGEALTIETTSLAVLAWLADARYAVNVEKSIQYLAECCKGGRFGSTQSTVLAVKAIVAYDESRAHPKASGTLELLVDGQRIGDTVAIDVDAEGAIELASMDDVLTPGKHDIEVRMVGGSQMPCSVAVDFSRLKPDTSEQCKVHLETKLRNTKLDEGSATEAEVVVVNRTGAAVPNPIAIVGIPGGLEVRHDQLKELVKAGKIAAYEVIGSELILYWRSLRAEERVDVPVSLIAAIPGTYTGPASRAYLYYTDEDKHWVDGFHVEITRSANEGHTGVGQSTGR